MNQTFRNQTIMNQTFRTVTRKIVSFIILSILVCSCQKSRQAGQEGFSFAFLTDIHLQPELNAPEGFNKAISEVNRLGPDFVLTGGDLIMDALGQTFNRADSLYDLYAEMSQSLEMPVHNTMGNHEEFGYYESSGVTSEHPFYGDKLFEDRLGKRYYAFDHKGWRFYIFDSVEEHEEGGYFGHIDQEQLDWLKQDLTAVDHETPIVISVHIPLITVTAQISEGSTTANNRGLVVVNSKDVLDLFGEHNLKLVLQGHLHSYEDIYINDMHFITSGAVCASWWRGPRGDLEEGFLMVHVKGEEISTDYIDYGWEVIN